MANPVVVVTGVGPGTGAAIARRFSRGRYAVAMLVRSRDRLIALEREIDGARAYPCDGTDEAALQKTLDAIRVDLGTPKVDQRYLPVFSEGALFVAERNRLRQCALPCF